jgi:hypothetical protein
VKTVIQYEFDWMPDWASQAASSEAGFVVRTKTLALECACQGFCFISR